jgi:hypothetical protein
MSKVNVNAQLPSVIGLTERTHHGSARAFLNKANIEEIDLDLVSGILLALVLPFTDASARDRSHVA